MDKNDLPSRTDHFLIENGLQRLVSAFRKEQITLDDFPELLLPANYKELEHLIPVLRDRLDFKAVLKQKPLKKDQETQVAFEQPINPRATLLEICKSNDSGKHFIQIYDATGMTQQPLQCRQLIKKSVVDYFYKIGNGHIYQPTFLEMTKIITNQIPGEDPKVSYIPGFGKKAPSGLLYTRYRYLQQHSGRFRQVKQIKTPTNRMDQQSDTAKKSWKEMDEPDRKCCQAAKLKLQATPLNNRSEIVNLWIKSFNLRRFEAVTGILKFSEWDILSNFDAIGELITHDFRIIFPPDNDVMVDRVPEFLCCFADIRVQYCSTLEEDGALLSEINSVLCNDFVVDDKAIFLAFLALPVLLPQGFIKLGKKRMRVSFAECRDSFIIMTHTEANVREIIDRNRVLARKRGITVQPYIIATGTLQDTTHAYFLVLDEIILKFTNAAIAFDTLFKIFHIFHLKYPPTCEMVYRFIERYFYNLPEDDQHCESSVYAALSDFKWQDE